MGCTVNVEEDGQCSWNVAASDTVVEDLKSQSKWNCLYVESKKNGTKELIYKTDTENKLMVTNGVRWGGINWETGIDIYTLLYIKQKTQGPIVGFSGSSAGKESACNAGDPGLIPGSRRSPGEGNSYPLQYSCPENSMDRGAWQVTVHGVAKSQTQLSDFHFTSLHFKDI